MFLREAVRRCAEIQEAIADLYEGVAARNGMTAEVGDLWRELARRERSRAKLLRAGDAAEEVLESEGPFLVHVPLQLANLRRIVDEARTARNEGAAGTVALDVLEKIEAADHRRLYVGLLELLRGDLAKVLRIVDTQPSRRRSDDALLAKLKEASTAHAAKQT